MAAKGKTALNVNIDPELLDAIDKYRHRFLFATRTEAMEYLLRFALKSNPKRDFPKS